MPMMAFVAISIRSTPITFETNGKDRMLDVTFDDLDIVVLRDELDVVRDQ